MMFRLAWPLFISAFVFLICESLAQPKSVWLQRWGKGDKYLCRCAKNIQCDKKTGECPNGECNFFKFGPGCVFERRIQRVDGHKWLADRDLNTCRPPGLYYIKVDPVYVVSVVRFVYATEASFDLRNILFYSRDGTRVCKNIMVVAKGKIKDLYCPSLDFAYSMVIRNEALIDLCELYFSAGQNVALDYKSAYQSSTSGSFGASLALDSVYYADRYDPEPLGCARTGLSRKPPWWEMVFKEPMRVFEFQFHNRYHQREELQYFTLAVFAENRSRIFTHKVDYFPTTHPVYNVFTQRALGNVKLVKVTGLMGKTLLTLCEVIIYGVCPLGRYGPSCIYSCDNCLHNLCAELDGTCLVACKIGYNCSVANWFTAYLQAGDSASAASTNTVWVLGLLMLPLNACLLIFR